MVSMWGKRGSAEHPAGDHLASDAEGPETSDYSNDTHTEAKQHIAKKHQNHDRHVDANSSHRSMFQIALSIIHLIPGAERVTFFNAAVLGILGALAALAAAAGGLSILFVLLARLYLPALETHVTLPMHFDYAAGPSAAGAWIPLLRTSPLTATLSPPHQRVSAAAAGLAPIQIQGNLGPGSSLSFSSSSGGGATGFWGQEGGFLGLGFGPASRAAAAASKPKVAAAKSGWFRRSRSKASGGSSSISSSSGTGVGGLYGGVDVGSGVYVPEREWLVPLWGRMGMKVVLEMPGWPETDLVQVTSEVVSQQGIVLGRSTRTWVPKPKPLLFRLMSSLIFGPWRALGLIDDTVRVQLPMFEAFQNPQAPPGGWGSVLELLKPGPASGPASAKGSKDNIGSKEGLDQGLGDSSSGSGGGRVAGPRAMWLRVTMIGRSAERGPPRVYRASAVLDMKLGLIDRVAAALRPSIPACLLLLLGSTVLAVVSGSTAACLLLAAYALYSTGSSIAAAGRDSSAGTSSSSAAPAHQKGKGSAAVEEEEQAGTGSSKCGDKPQASAESTKGPKAQGATRLDHTDSDLSHATGVVGSKKAEDEQQGFNRGFAPASAGESSSSSSETFEDAAGDQETTSRLQQNPQQQGRGTVTKPLASEKGETIDMQPMSSKLQAKGSKAPKQQQQKQVAGEGGSGAGAVSAIAKLVAVKEQQQQQTKPTEVVQKQQQQPGRVMRGSGETEAEEELMHDTGVSGVAADDDDEWQEQLLADTDSAGSSRSSHEGGAAASAAREVVQYPAGEGFMKDDSTAVTAGAAMPSKRSGYRYQT